MSVGVHSIHAGRFAETIDIFHRGRFALVQPKGRGHRAGMDAMMLAAAVPDGFSGQLADLGAGAGAAGLAVASRCPEARIVLVERSAEMANYARRSLDLDRNAHLTERISVVEADVTLTGARRRAAGLADGTFDFALMNPPFNDAGHREPGDALKREAHLMDPEALAGWVRTASAIVRPRGGFAAILRPEAIGAIVSACAGRFGALEIKPIQPRDDAVAIRIVVRGVRGSRARLTLLPPLALHDAGDRFGEIADAINNGRRALF